MLPIVDHFLRRRQEQEAGRRLRIQRRLLRDNSEPFDLPEERFIELFRLTKILTQNLIEQLIPHLDIPKYRSGISVPTKVLAALRFYATGGYQRSVGEGFHLGLSQTSVCR